MSELIERQAAIDECNKRGAEHIGYAIAHLPTVQPEVLACGNGELVAKPEPQEGHWIWVAGDLECSKCHTRYPDLYPDYDNSVACPHCGAKMKGEPMSELIDRQQAIDAINSWRGRFSEEYNEAIDDCENSIKELPTAQPEQKKGEWSDGYRWQRCSLCKQTGKKSWNYCPNCGADMRGGQDDSF